MNKNKEYLLSVLIPTWNRVDSVITAINSIGENNLRNVEVIIVDNCSDITTFQLLKEKIVSKDNIKLFRNSSNLGMVKNFNKCVEYATGEWVSLICSDDQFTQTAITRILDLIKTIKTPTLLIQDPTLINDIEIFPKGSATVRKLRLPIFSGNVWHSEITKKLGGFDERIKYSPDAEFWSRIAYNYPVIFLKEHTAIYNETSSNYGFSSWHKKDFLTQVKLLGEINCNYLDYINNKDKKKSIHQGVNSTILTILFNLLFKKKELPTFFKYFILLILININPLRWKGLTQTLVYLRKKHKLK